MQPVISRLSLIVNFRLNLRIISFNTLFTATLCYWLIQLRQTRADVPLPRDSRHQMLISSNYTAVVHHFLIIKYLSNIFITKISIYVGLLESWAWIRPRMSLSSQVLFHPLLIFSLCCRMSSLTRLSERSSFIILARTVMFLINTLYLTTFIINILNIQCSITHSRQPSSQSR